MKKTGSDNLGESEIGIVLFDFGGVIAEEGFVNGLRAIAVKAGVDPEEFLKAGFDIIHRDGYVTGRSGEETFWQTLRDETGIGGTDQELRKEILSRFILRQWIFDLIGDLKASNVQVGILSDQTNWLDELDLRYRIYERFDYVFNSYHLGESKRGEEVFKTVMKQVGLAADRAVFIDDNEGNCTRARNRGLHAIVYRTAEQFLEELKQYFPHLDADRYTISS